MLNKVPAKFLLNTIAVKLSNYLDIKYTDIVNLDSRPARDEVDRIVAAWRRERPDLDPSPMLVLSRVSRLARHLDLARRKAFTKHNLESWEFDVLSSLRRSGPPYALTPGLLMAELLVSSGTMTNRIDRLEQKELVRRSPSHTDRRAVQVTLTDEGLHRVDSALESLLAAEKQILASLSNHDAARLAQTLRPLLIAFDQIN